MSNREELEKILNKENIIRSIKNNIKSLLNIIPEIKDMIGFEHKHPHHHLDVWEHTLYALSLAPNNFDIKLALLLHDIGKPHSFQIDGEVRHYKGHAEKSAQLTNLILKRLNYNKDYVAYICKMVELHDTPLEQDFILKNTKLAKTIFKVQKCDALAHNPEKNKKRLEYIEQITKLFNDLNIEKSICN